MREADFFTTIADLKKIIGQAEIALESGQQDEFVFHLFKPLRNSGGEGGFGQHEEACEYFVGKINLIPDYRDRGFVKTKSTPIDKIKERAKRFSEAIHKAWYEYALQDLPFVKQAIKPDEFPCPGPTEFKCPHLKTCAKWPCCHIDFNCPEMREHLEMYHPRPDHRLFYCRLCGKFFKILHPTTEVCYECHILKGDE